MTDVASPSQSRAARNAYMRSYLRRYREEHPELCVAFCRNRVLSRARKFGRMPSTRSIARYGLTADELKAVFAHIVEGHVVNCK